MNTGQPIRLLLAKIGLDGHDRGVKVLARSFRDAGVDVIYTGLWQTAEATMYAAMQEDVDVVGVSLLSAAHLTVMPEVLRWRGELGIDDVPVILGGIVPEDEHPQLLEMGCAAVFNPGSSLTDINARVRTLAGSRRRLSVADAVTGYESRREPALAQLLTHIQRGAMDGWTAPSGQATVIGVTGAPGVGKSSVIGRLGKALCNKGLKAAVVAVDPSSPLHGGALLGDRLRMMTGPPQPNFFVRSMSSGGAYGGLGPRCGEVVAALTGYGFDVILVESVGAGQADTAIRDLVDHTMLVLMPESGDAVQFSKAGIMEIAESFLLNKSDLPGVDATEAQLVGSVGSQRPIFRISTTRNQGIDKVADWVMSDLIKRGRR